MNKHLRQITHSFNGKNDIFNFFFFNIHLNDGH